jgi:hypothetical protein
MQTICQLRLGQSPTKNHRIAALFRSVETARTATKAPRRFMVELSLS